MKRSLGMLCALLVAGVAGATTNESARLSRSDQKFVKKAALAGMCEVELGKIGKENASSTQVKRFAEMMIDDHSGNNEDLEELAEAKDFRLPKHDEGARAKKRKLEDLTGPDFDRAYMDLMVEEHEAAVSLFERANCEDPDLARYVDETLPKLKHHLAEAKSVKRATE